MRGEGVPAAEDRIAVSVAEAARLTGLHRCTINNYIREGTGPKSLKIGRRRLVLVDSLRPWLESRDAAEGSG